MSDDDLLDLTVSIAREVGANLLSTFNATRPEVQAKSTPTDLVSEADYAAERLIRERIAAVRPDDAIVGEEEGSTTGTSELQWIVDPLDGTVNFLSGIPHWCVSIACELASGEGMIGVVYDPGRDEMFTAARSRGAALNGKPLIRSRSRPLSRSVVATGFGYDSDVRALQGREVAEILPLVADIRRVGAAALDLAWLAAGRFDVYFERGVNRWDMAAGVQLCSHVGLAARELSAKPPAGPGIVVGEPQTVDPLYELLT